MGGRHRVEDADVPHLLGLNKEKRENGKIVKILHFQFTPFASTGVTNGPACASSIAVGTVAGHDGAPISNSGKTIHQ